MKKLKLLILLSLISLNLYCQADSSKIQIISVPNTEVDIYYINQKPKLINGMAFTGNDTFNFTKGNEKIFAVETFKDGFKTELKTFFDNGNPEIHYQWKNGKRDGISKRWYKSGIIMYNDIMKEGENVGSHISFFENGNPQFVDEKNKSGIYMTFYGNGKLQTLAKYFNDSIKCEGNEGFEETRWYENGQLMLKRIENCGKQSVKWYYNDTTVSSEGTEVGMALFLVGKHTEYYKNGKLKLEANYQDGITQSEANIKTGTWRYWNEKGKLEKEEFYENNELKKTKVYVPEKKNTKIKKGEM